MKANFEPIMSVNVSAVKLVSLQAFFLMLEQRHLVGSHGNCLHGGDGGWVTVIRLKTGVKMKSD